MGVGRRTTRSSSRAAAAKAGRGGGRGGADLDETEVDAFHRTRLGSLRKNAARLELIGDGENGEGDLSDSSSEEAVLDIEEDASESESESDLSEEDEDSSDDNDDAVDEDKKQRLGSRKLLARMEAQQAAMRAQMVDGDEDSENEDDEEGEGDDDGRWGRNKKTYYHSRGDDEAVEQDADGEDLRGAEEEEARRLQSKTASRYRVEDFELDEDEDDEDEDEDDDEGGEKSGEPKKRFLSPEEEAAIIESDAPELSSLLSDLKGTMDEVRNVVKPMLDEVKLAKSASAGLIPPEISKDGISFLESKYLLMLSYSSHLVLYLLMKAEGKPVKHHPLLSRLVELRTFMEKIRPIEKKMRYQIQKLVSSSKEAAKDNARAGMATDASDPLRFGPNPAGLMSRKAGGIAAVDSDGDGDGIYRPPRIAPVAYDGGSDEEDGEGDEEARPSTRGLAMTPRQRKKALESEYVRELVSEMGDAPVEISTDPTRSQRSFVQREKQRMLRRAEAEEEMFTRTPLTRTERKRLKAAKTTGFHSTSAVLEDIGTDIADLVDGGMDDTVDDDENAAGKLSRHRHGLTDLIGGRGARKSMRSGDEDLPVEGNTLNDRRIRHEQALSKKFQKRQRQQESDDDHDDYGGQLVGEEDEYYKQARERSESKKEGRRKRKQLSETPSEAFPPLEDARADGKRQIGYDIAKNRGLTPNRNKALKNPRKKHRVKYGKAVIRRKGQVQDQRERSQNYGGEATGIKTKVSKSVRL